MHGCAESSCRSGSLPPRARLPHAGGLAAAAFLAWTSLGSGCGEVAESPLLPAAAMMFAGIVLVIRAGSRTVPSETSPM